MDFKRVEMKSGTVSPGLSRFAAMGTIGRRSVMERVQTICSGLDIRKGWLKNGNSIHFRSRQPRVD